MTEPVTEPARLDWQAIRAGLDRNGHSLTPPLLTPAECTELAELFDDDSVFRNTVVMARHQYGEGVYRYFDHPLPATVARLRKSLYPPLAVIANEWPRGCTPRATRTSSTA